jgi:hypothetical protein
MKPKRIIPLMVLLLLVGASSCTLPDFALPQAESQPTADSATPGTLVTFFVEIPANTPAEQPVIFSLLDEVSGLALNAERLEMEKVDETHYAIGLPLEIGSTIKYRYSRQGPVLAEEHTTDGRPVRYRMYYVAGPGDVFDVVSRWTDTLPEGATGRINGRLLDSESGAPLPGLLVAAGGAQVFSAGDGSFLIEGLPPGTHNLVAYALDGAYCTFQQGALVAAESSTPAEIKLMPTPKVDITFVVHVPANTPPIVPLRFAGNLFQLGNTFANLAGGVSTLAERMPALTALPDGTYGIILGLPVGADLQYKYTLGDGFWNAERNLDGELVLRQLIVPDSPTVIEDTITTWHFGPIQPITFDINVPDNTPESVSLQLNPYGWTEALPMWPLGGTRWAYILFSPLDMVGQLGYRYCRAGQCGQADDARTPGGFTSGQIAKPGGNSLDIPDQIEEWAWLEDQLPQVGVTDTKVPPRGSEFMAGIEFQEFYHPSWLPRIPTALEDVSAKNANWLVLTPSWTYTRIDPPVLEPVAGQDALWLENISIIRQASKRGLNVALRPVPHFPTTPDEWWAYAQRDFPWWVTWFDSYSAFAIHHAELAAQSGAKTLILGGDWMGPALPEGTLADGSSSGVPPDADTRYRDLIAEVRQHFEGTIAWALPYPEGVLNPPTFLDAVDQIVILWSAALMDNPDAGPAELQTEAEKILNNGIFSLRLTWEPPSGEKSIIVSLAYPSADGVLTGCLADPIEECLPPAELKYPAPDYPLLELDLVEQAKAYDAVLAAINQTDWIDGVISMGYYPPAILHDKSTSVHGKPAEDVLAYWFGRFLREE